MHYEYTCKNCGYIFEKSVRLANRLDAIEAPCPECGEVGSVEQYIGTVPLYVDNHKLMTGKKPDGAFRERLSKIHEQSPGSILNNNVGYRI